MDSVQADNPQNFGLDTSLAHVGRSLATRHEDSTASKSFFYQRFPRSHQLDSNVADSKIGTWWLVKYKNRFLSDGSVTRGNPIVTNILWNEIGRGSSLEELEEWMEKNPIVMRDLTNAVYNAQAPRWTDFFLASSIDVSRAQKGEELFNSNCMQCHGVYEKAWSKGARGAEQLNTTRVSYFKNTPVIDVGTDANRRQGMRELSTQLNRLRITQKYGIYNQEQKGYVPPPLEGIWARYPYFHNNSAPNLCAVLTPENLRPTEYYQGPSSSTADFDQDCVGYPVGDKIPAAWKKDKGIRFSVTRKGLSNKGHTKMLLNADGSERYSAEDKKNIIEYLKTL